MQKIRRMLCVGSGDKDGALVVLQNLNPRRDIGGVTIATSHDKVSRGLTHLSSSFWSQARNHLRPVHEQDSMARGLIRGVIMVEASRFAPYWNEAKASFLFGIPGTIAIITGWSVFSDGAQATFADLNAQRITFVITASIGVAFLVTLILLCRRAKQQREFPLLAALFLAGRGFIYGNTIVFVPISIWNFSHGWPTRSPDMYFLLVGWTIGPAIDLWWYFGRSEGQGIGLTLRKLGSDLRRMYDAGFFLVCIIAAAIGIYYLLTWEPPPVPNAGHGKTLNDAIILLIAHLIWDFWAAKFAAIGLLAYVVWLGIGATREVLAPGINPTSHGEARTATREELRRATLIPRKENIYLGRFAEQKRVMEQVGFNGGTHLITIGPNGSGKGTGVIMPNLADLPRSILIIDPKGEAAAITARKRVKIGRVVVLNPFGVLVDERPWLQSNGFNPLARFDPRSQYFPDDATGIAEALIKVEGTDPHWSSSAQELISALVMWECVSRPKTASISHVRKMLTEPFTLSAKGDPLGLAKTVFEMLESGYPPLEAKSGRFAQPSREIQSIISTAITQTRFLDSPAISNDLTQDGFDFADMKREIVTVYLILPADRLETHSGWLRLMIVSALRTLLRTPPSKKLPPVLFLLDEFAQLGYLPSIENAMGIARGFGVQLWPIIQDLNQLKALYKDRWETFIGARGALMAFAPQDLFTADYLSKLCGQKTEFVQSGSSGFDGKGGSINIAPQGFPLFRPEKLMAMPPSQMLCFVDPIKNPFFTSAPGYWNMPLGRGLDPNPYFQPRR